MNKTLWMSMVILSLASACGSAQKDARVIRLEDGTYSAVGVADDQADASLRAVSSAEKYCDRKDDKEPVFSKEALPKDPAPGSQRMKLENLPVVGDVFKGEDRTQVVVAFRCEEKQG